MTKGKGPKFIVPFKRRREGKTNYRKRLALVKSGLPRLVVRPSNRGVLVQILEFHPKGDVVLAHAHSRELKKYGWVSKRNLPTAYLTGYLCALRYLQGNKEKGTRFVLDIGFATPTRNNITFSAMKGAVDAGLETNYDPEIISDESRIRGEHIADYARKLKEEDEGKYKKMFSEFLSMNVQPEDIPGLFDEVKNKIKGDVQ